MGARTERLQQLDNIEKEIAGFLQSSGQALTELAKEKPSMKAMENYTSNFLKALESVDSGLSRQIQYLTQVSTGQSHEGSSYSSQKELQMTLHRLEHAKSRVTAVERLAANYIPAQTPATTSVASTTQPQSDMSS